MTEATAQRVVAPVSVAVAIKERVRAPLPELAPARRKTQTPPVELAEMTWRVWRQRKALEPELSVHFVDFVWLDSTIVHGFSLPKR